MSIKASNRVTRIVSVYKTTGRTDRLVIVAGRVGCWLFQHSYSSARAKEPFVILDSPSRGENVCVDANFVVRHYLKVQAIAAFACTCPGLQPLQRIRKRETIPGRQEFRTRLCLLPGEMKMRSGNAGRL
jgi:hypothetical protein